MVLAFDLAGGPSASRARTRAATKEPLAFGGTGFGGPEDDEDDDEELALLGVGAVFFVDATEAGGFGQEGGLTGTDFTVAGSAAGSGRSGPDGGGPFGREGCFPPCIFTGGGLGTNPGFGTFKGAVLRRSTSSISPSVGAEGGGIGAEELDDAEKEEA